VDPWAPEGLVVVGVNAAVLAGDDAALMAAFVEQTGIAFPVGWDRSDSYEAFPKLGQTSPFPLHVLVDRQGRIAYLGRDHAVDALEAAVAQLMVP
jgi:hypothetical protein